MGPPAYLGGPPGVPGNKEAPVICCSVRLWAQSVSHGLVVILKSCVNARIDGLAELGAIRASSRDLLAEYLLAAGGLELIELPVELLISGADPGIVQFVHRTGGEQPPLRPQSIEECEGRRALG
jgi:hypothetical protein